MRACSLPCSLWIRPSSPWMAIAISNLATAVLVFGLSVCVGGKVLPGDKVPYLACPFTRAQRPSIRALEMATVFDLSLYRYF